MTKWGLVPPRKTDIQKSISVIQMYSQAKEEHHMIVTTNAKKQWTNKTQHPFHDKDPEKQERGTSLPYQASTENLHIATAALREDWMLLLEDQELVDRVLEVSASARKQEKEPKANRLEGKK